MKSHYMTHRFLLILIFLTFSTHVKLKAAWSVIFDIPNYAGYNISCFNGDDGLIKAHVIGGQPPFTYSWSNNQTDSTINHLSAGWYVLTLTDANNNMLKDSVELIQPGEFSVELTPSIYGGDFNISINNYHNGYINTSVYGGNPPYSYTWSNSETSENLDNLPIGTYSVVVTDADGCTATQSQVMIEPPALLIAGMTSTLHNGKNISCYNGNDGVINLTITGGVPDLTYSWSNGNHVEDISLLQAGTYSVIVTDFNGAQTTSQITLTQPNQLVITTTPSLFPNGKNISCYDCYNGEIITSVSGGIQNYSYLWTASFATGTFANTLSIDTLRGGDYQITITDANGCTASRSLHMSEPEREDWKISGNSVSDTTKFIGTTNNQDLVFKANNNEKIRITSDGDIKLKAMVGTDFRLLTVNPGGKVEAGPVFIPDDVPSLCSEYMLLNPNWYFAGGNNLINCKYDFGFGIVPEDKVHIAGFCRFSQGNSDYLKIGFDNSSRIESYGSGELKINDDSPQNVSICNGGGVVSIGDPPSLPGDYKLFVMGGILTEKLRVANSSGTYWADHVFNKNYKLKSLSELKRFIEINKHLPEIPTASEVNVTGIDVLEFETKLLQKVEELTLYIIELNEKYESLKKQNLK